MRTRRKLRLDRVIAVISITLIPIVLLICFKNTNNYNDKSDIPVNKTKEQSSVSTICTTQSITSIQTTVTQTTMIDQIYTPSCKAAALYCVDEERFLYSDNIYERIAPASLTKILTAAAALEYLNTEEILTVGSEQYLVQPYSSLCGVQAGSTASLKDFVTGMLMASGNDAAYTIAVSAARKLNPDVCMTDTEAVEYFCGLMNNFARRIGMTRSNFVNPDGWDDANHYTTVSDLVILSEYAMKIPEIKEISGTYYACAEFISGEIYEWTNSNLLLNPYSCYYCKDVIGMKTGTTQNAGSCLICVCCKNNNMYISVVVGCDSDEARYELTLKLIEEAK